MSYIQLDDVTEDILLGAWRVKTRMTNRSSAANLFAKCNCLKFLNNSRFSTKAQNGKLNKGQWHMVREREMIYNPQVRFQLGKEVLVNSIITNLMTEDSIHYKLILYFDSGLELVLEKDEQKNNCPRTRKM